MACLCGGPGPFGLGYGSVGWESHVVIRSFVDPGDPVFLYRLWYCVEWHYMAYMFRLFMERTSSSVYDLGSCQNK